MKIVSYEEMVELPVGSVFCKYEPCVLYARWTIKTGKTTTNELTGKRIFLGVMDLEPWGDIDDMPHGVGSYTTEMSINDSASYDIGEKGDLFAVLEDYEIIKMIWALIWALKKCECDFEEIFKEKEKRNEKNHIPNANERKNESKS